MNAAVRLDWIRAGQRLLRERGISGVKVRELAREVGLTTGSLYHHFESFDAYLAQLAAQYALDSERLERSVRGLAPGDRIAALLRVRVDADVPALDRAMRIWAESSGTARSAVSRVDHAVLEVVEAAFLELGFEPPEARARARTAFAAGIGLGLMDAPWPVGEDEEARAVRLFTTGHDLGASGRVKPA